MNRETSLAAFLDTATSSYLAVAEITELLLTEGYTPLQEAEEWNLSQGGKYFLSRNDASLFAFRLPKKKAVGFQIAAAHTDSPAFQYKKSFTASGYTRLSVERYGGARNVTWLDRPLSVSGRVFVKKEGKLLSYIVDVKEPVAIIPSVAGHLMKETGDNPAVDMLPFCATDKEGDAVLYHIAEALKIDPSDIVSHDLYMYPYEKAVLWGKESCYISSPRLDDLQSVYGLLQGFLSAEDNQKAIPLLALFDSEEVGSRTMHGADSSFLNSVLERIALALGENPHCLLANSFLVSADNAHARHPNHPELSDTNGLTPVLNEGIVIKHNANKRYTTDGLSEGLFSLLCEQAGVPLQHYANRPDLLGGSTLGALAISHTSVYSLDIGLAQLAMHSAMETAGTKDTLYLEKAMALFFARSLYRDKEGIGWA
ncbi:MAG: M18 family aminopeptidase [Clostridia bacterium]|nr:M18 family aminopeptidase [Clostridia bacterium]